MGVYQGDDEPVAIEEVHARSGCPDYHWVRQAVEDAFRFHPLETPPAYIIVCNGDTVIQQFECTHEWDRPPMDLLRLAVAAAFRGETK